MNKRDIDKAWSEYNRIVDNVAKDLFNRKILPYLKKHNYCFLSGNGTYYIGKYTPGKGSSQAHGYLSDWTDIDTDKLPKEIYDILQMEIEGMRGVSLGALMPNYEPDI